MVGVVALAVRTGRESGVGLCAASGDLESDASGAHVDFIERQGKRSPGRALWTGWTLPGFAFSFSFSCCDWIIAFGLRRPGVFV